MGWAHEVVTLEGHIVDSLTLAKVLDRILAFGADYELRAIEVGRTNLDATVAELDVSAPNDAVLAHLLEELQTYGVNRVVIGDAVLAVADHDGVFPANFYSTTNLPTSVSIDGRWHAVDRLEMDCGIAVRDGPIVETVPMHRVRVGDRIVVGDDGVRVTAPERPPHGLSFEFMGSEVSSEKPKAMLVARVAEQLTACKAAGSRVLLVCGPAVIHTGAGPDVAQLVREGWIDVLFAGNGFATHDLESNVLGTSLGVSVRSGAPSAGGHANHLRVINEIRRFGSIAAAVEGGYVTGGVMYECVQRGVPFVLGGSVRDDGPLPDVLTDVVEAADAMRTHLDGIGVCLMLASTLHAIATGNLLPASVQTYCVDINQAVATKLSDRGSHQALGIVTDVGLFLRDLTADLGARDR
jgi:lysine-ketoglutarate reductase/saccharopine dehydrogenase-like protein (TIGR00300 family)